MELIIKVTSDFGLLPLKLFSRSKSNKVAEILLFSLYYILVKILIAQLDLKLEKFFSANLTLGVPLNQFNQQLYYKLYWIGLLFS